MELCCQVCHHSKADELDLDEWTASLEPEWDSLFFPGINCSRPMAMDSDACSEEVLISHNSFRVELDQMPTPQRPQGDEKHLIVDDQHVPDLTIGKIEDALQSDSVVLGYLQNFSKASDISLSAWCTAPGGVRVRRAHFTMPVPQEIPGALARLISLPQASKATMLLGFVAAGADELLVVLQQCTHDVPYGENFRVHETMSFRPHAEGGVTFSKWTVVRWIKALPFMMAPMRPITESKTAAGSPGGAEAFLHWLRQAVR